MSVTEGEVTVFYSDSEVTRDRRRSADWYTEATERITKASSRDDWEFIPWPQHRTRL